MDLAEKADAALAVIAALRQELSVARDKGGNYESACEYLMRWRNHAAGTLRKRVSSREADRFAPDGNWPPPDFEAQADEYDGIRAALAEALESHPEDILPDERSLADQLCGSSSSLRSGSDPFLDAVSTVVRICRRFHLVARELNHRRADRQPLKMDDEYDVQYLLGAPLKLDFDDVRAEEPTPSCAGKSSRIDFFLQDEGLAVEAKNTRDGLRNAQLGTELNDDKARYGRKPGCRGLVCLVYDPDDLLKNPTAVEKDLSETEGRFLVQVVVSPRHI